jgi:hypothetical protein
MSVSPQPRTAMPALAGRVPDFFIVGHAKCGTTALYEMLRRHPQIYMPALKEPQYFARNPDAPLPPPGVKSFEQTGRFRETYEQYLARFADAQAGQRVGEASTFYLWSRTAPARIAAANPAARIIAILREPASFVRSLHLQMLENNAESERDLRRALALEQERRGGSQIPPNSFWPAALIYTDRVRYAEQLRRYHAVFPREQVLVLIYDDFRADNEGTLRRVLRFLEVEEALPEVGVEANSTVAVRSVRVHTFMRDVRAGRGRLPRATRSAVKGLTTPALRWRLLYPLRRRLLFGAPPAVDEQVLAELRARFKGEVEAVSDYLGRDLVHEWGYDRVG